MELMLFEQFVNSHNYDFDMLKESLSTEIEYLQSIDESEIDLLNEAFLKNINQVAQAYFSENEDEECWKSKIKEFVKVLLGVKPIPKLMEEIEKLLASNKYYGFMSTC